MKEHENQTRQPNLRELVAFLATKNMPPGIWRGLLYGILSGNI